MFKYLFVQIINGVKMVWATKEKANTYNRNYRRAHPKIDKKYHKLHPLINRIKCAKYRAAHPDRIKMRREKLAKEGYFKQKTIRYRTEAFNVLGGAKCVSCGCNVFELLSVNHINGDGKEDRKNGFFPNKIVILIAKRKIDINKFNVLCRACNWIDFFQRKYGVNYKITWLGRNNESTNI